MPLMAETALLKSIWRWKVLTYPLAKEIAFKKISYGNYYDKIRRLIGEGLIIERPVLGIGCTVLQLSKKGFELIKYELGDLRENRFAAQNVTHDYWASAVQIGEFIQGLPEEVRFFTEQQLQCTDDSLLPEWVPKSRSHIPDGLTHIKGDKDPSVIAFEVELNLKPLLRYDKAGYYFDAGLSKFDVVIWFCANKWIIQEISARLAGLKLRNHEIHQFLLTSDFRVHGWNAKIEQGSMAGTSLREIYSGKGLGSLPEHLWNSSGTGLHKIFFSRSKSRKGLGL